MSETRYFLVSGRVQGVGFRAATQRQALQLSLDGWVRNRHDGAVELMAAGSAGDLDALRDWLGHGPASAHVTRVIEQSADDEALPAPFTIA